MLKRVGQESVVPAVKIADAKFPAPFVSGLEYGAPARGTWNIVHVGMLIPRAHQIFVCAQGCLRGVVLTAAEMNASDRFSTIVIREQNVLDGDMEDLIIDGVTDILERLPECPPAVLIYTSCIHHFMGSDLNYAYRVLRERFPDVQFTDCYMNPIMRKSGLTPDQTMRRQLYSLLKKDEQNVCNGKKSVHIAGWDFPLDRESELYKILSEAGYEICEVSSCKTYEEYQELSKCDYAITTFPAAKVAGEYLEKEFSQKHIYIPASFSYEKIEENISKLMDMIPEISQETAENILSEKKAECEKALEHAKEILGDTEIQIDFTAFPFMLSLARLLIEKGFRVTKLYTDSFIGEEREHFDWLREHAPELEIYPTVHASMRVHPRTDSGEKKVLAIGQKAAYFSGTDRFANLVEGAGFWGYSSITKLARLMCDALETPKDTKGLIQIKGMGCGSCL